jgi:hypothetical protein
MSPVSTRTQRAQNREIMKSYTSDEVKAAKSLLKLKNSDLVGPPITRSQTKKNTEPTTVRNQIITRSKTIQK